MSFQHAVAAIGVATLVTISGSPSLAAQTSAGRKASPSELSLAEARRVVGADRARVRDLETLIEQERLDAFSEGWSVPRIGQWDWQLPGTAKKALESLELKVARARQQLARDQAVADGLETPRVSSR